MGNNFWSSRQFPNGPSPGYATVYDEYKEARNVLMIEIKRSAHIDQRKLTFSDAPSDVEQAGQDMD